MTSKKLNKTTKTSLKQVVLGLVSVAALSVFAYTGSLSKRSNTPILISAYTSNYNVSVDELSELYVMSNVAEMNNFPSTSIILASYYNAKVQYATNQYSASAGKIEKPTITNATSEASSVISHPVQEGDTMESIIAALQIPGLTTDQVRWSNGLKTTSITAGSTLYIPKVAGIVYVTKSGDTPASLADRYSSDASRICSVNNYGDNCSLSDGQRIVLPGGILPETERPEYVAPKPTVTRYTLSYSSSNKYYPGQCTWFAWQWRHDNGYGDLPGNLGNARTWGIRAAAGGYTVNKTPSYGAVFVDTSGSYYGHVGIVVAVNGDGTLTVREMNYVRAYAISERVVPSSTWSRWTFIH